MATEKVKIPKDLMDKVRRLAALSGYASAEEFILHCLEKEVAQVEESSSEDEVKKKLKGLGYIG
jgi:metal-responsive CopG/Arc/MetJ family transcriptional regulator